MFKVAKTCGASKVASTYRVNVKIADKHGTFDKLATVSQNAFRAGDQRLGDVDRFEAAVGVADGYGNYHKHKIQVTVANDEAHIVGGNQVPGLNFKLDEKVDQWVNLRDCQGSVTYNAGPYSSVTVDVKKENLS